MPPGKCMSQAIGIKDVLSARLTGCAAVLSDLDECLISTDTAISLSARLAGMGLTIAPGRIFLAGEQTLRRIAAEQPGARIALYAAAPMHDLARDLGLITDRKHPQVAVLAREPGSAFGDLRELTAHLHRGLPIWVTNGDASHPGPDGTPEPEAGALFAALSAAVPGIVCRQLETQT